MPDRQFLYALAIASVTVCSSCGSRTEPAETSPPLLLGTNSAPKVPASAENSTDAEKRSESPSADHEAVIMAAKLYEIGQGMYAHGDMEQALALWARAVLELPPTPRADVIRHILIIRMSYALLIAGLAPDRRALVDGRDLLLRYLDRHQRMFADDKGAEARIELYALLGEFEARIDNTDAADVSMNTRIEALGLTADSDVLRAFTEGEYARKSRIPAGRHAGRDLDAAGEVRNVKVRSKRFEFASPDHPRVRAYFLDDRFLGPSLFDAPPDPYNPTRGLVRFGLATAPSNDSGFADQRVARHHIVAVGRLMRPILQRCYENSLARTPVMHSRVTIEATVRESGVVSNVRLADGSVADARADACVHRAFALGPISSARPTRDVVVRLPILFFVQKAQYPGGGDRGIGDASAAASAAARAGDGPPLDAPAGPPQPR